MNEDFHMFFQLRGWKDVNSWALHSAAFYFLNATHALWEEARLVHQYNVSGGAKHQLENHIFSTIPKFIVGLAEDLIASGLLLPSQSAST